MTMTQEESTRFIEWWQRHDNSLAEIAAAFGVTPREATVTASDLRNNGVELLDRRCKPALDYEALARVAQEAK